MTNVLKIHLLHEDAKMPYRANEGDAGLDVHAIEEITIEPGATALIRTGLQMELPKGTEAQIRPRSGLAFKHAVTVLNSPGTIDEGYRGELKVLLINHGKQPFTVEKEMRIAQMVIAPVMQVDVEEVKTVTDSERGQGGFGSSGK